MPFEYLYEGKCVFNECDFYPGNGVNNMFCSVHAKLSNNEMETSINEFNNTISNKKIKTIKKVKYYYE